MNITSENDLVEAIKSARAPFRPTGGGSRINPAQTALPRLELGGLDQVALYEPGALTLVVGAGARLADVDALLAAEGQRLAFEPPNLAGLLGHKTGPTVGGIVAANASGPRRIQVGACRDHCLGLRFVDGAGTITANGGRVMKNVTGYDLVKLQAGAMGTLGVLSQVSLKVLARPEAEATIIIHGATDTAAVQTLSRALGSPFDVSGAAHLPAGILGATPRTLVRIEGLAGSVQYRATQLRALLNADDIITDVVSRELWAQLRDVTPFVGQTGDVWRISVKPTQGPGVGEALRALKGRVFYDWGGGLIWALMPVGTDAASLRGHVAGGGHASLIRGATGPVFHPAPAPIAAIEAGLRQRFDPRGLFNPGLMGAAQTHSKA